MESIPQAQLVSVLNGILVEPISRRLKAWRYLTSGMAIIQSGFEKVRSKFTLVPTDSAFIELATRSCIVHAMSALAKAFFFSLPSQTANRTKS